MYVQYWTCESDEEVANSVIQGSTKVKTLILAHTHVPQVRAVPRLVNFVLKVDHAPYHSLPAMSTWALHRSLFEAFVTRLGHLQDELDHITADGEPTCGVENKTVGSVVMDPYVSDYDYFQEAEFYMFRPE